MSWDQFIDNLVEYCRDSSGVPHCDRACIIGLDSGVCWTSGEHSKALKILKHEAEQLATCMKRRDFTSLATNGITVEGQRYLFLRSEEGKAAYAKKRGNGGLTIHSTKSAVIIAHCVEGRQQGNVNKGTGMIADYLESVNM
jgi:profilin